MLVLRLVSKGQDRASTTFIFRLCVCPAKGVKKERRRRDSNPRYPVKRYYGAVMPLLFADVQKHLQVSVFLLFSHRRCSSWFMQVGVSVGVNGVTLDVDLYL
jgi:hypothetical protein